jgi:integrase
MASITKRTNKDGTSHWRVIIRLKGHPTVCNHFDRKQEAENWASDTERQIRIGKYSFTQHKEQHTFTHLLERYINDGALEHIRSADDVMHHLLYWKERLGNYALIYLTPDLIGKERQALADSPTTRKQKRSAATVNRYISSLSALFSFSVKLRWMEENPCFNLTKLKENPGRDRILSDEEIPRLLASCRQSKSCYLYPFVLMTLTTGSRQGELLGLEWRHVDFENKLAYLKETKNGRPGSISLSDQVIEELKALYQKRNLTKPLVFASKTAFGRIDLKKSWSEALKRAEIKDFRSHDMRHTFCTLAARQGGSNLELATCMGHRALNMLQRYTHLDVQVTKKFSKQISEQILQGVLA